MTGGAGDAPALRGLLVVGAVIVVVQAAILALVAIPAPHPGGDNTAYLALGHALAQGLGYVELWDPEVPLHTKYPPVYPLVLSGMMLLGATTWVAFKASSAVAISLATLLAFAWAGRRRGAIAGGAVALLLVLASGWQEASRWVLSEPWFLLWTYLALWAGERGLAENGRRWLLVAGAGALLAFGVRTAGLPVVLGLLVALFVARRNREALVFGAVALLAVGGWMLRTARGGEGAYQAEFWLVNPYEPELGTVGLVGLLGRVWTNLGLYLTGVLPGEWGIGAPASAAAAVGLLMGVLALAGWVRSSLRGPGPAELFAPLYSGMILLWPDVWSGDRFLLPLLPLGLLYMGEGLALVGEAVGRWAHGPRGGSAKPESRRGATIRGRTPRGRGAIPDGAPSLLVGGPLALGVLALSLSALPGTFERVSESGECRHATAVTGDVYACHPPGIHEFRAAAAWMGANLPGNAVALSRKPRILYALDGPRGRTFPFTQDPARFLEEADRMGARYLLFDRWDGIASYYLPPVISGQPGAFCFVNAWGSGGETPPTQLFGILPPAERRSGASLQELGSCPDGWVLPAGPGQPVPEGVRVPLLIPRSP
jgi:hypothetical protein